VKWSTRFEPGAQADLRKIDRHTAMRVLRKLAELETDPYGLGTTELVSRPGVRRLRVGDYRVFYTLEHGQLVIWVVAVVHRSTAYEG
jgi:Cytotoxic translational repressor of toxin-antitoxin stability system